MGILSNRVIVIFCIIILLALAFKVSYDNKDNNCGECTVKFQNKIGGTYLVYVSQEYVISDLLESLVNGHCDITWDPNQGYIKNG